MAFAKCSYCKQEMKPGVGCVKVPIAIELAGKVMDPVPHSGDGVCHDCNAPVGGYHHPGCDMERCPHCGGQLISCGCLSDD